MLAGVLQPLADRGDPRHAEHAAPCWIALRMLWSAFRCNVTLSCKPVLACTGPTCRQAVLTCGQVVTKSPLQATPLPAASLVPTWTQGFAGSSSTRWGFGFFGGCLGASSVCVHAKMHDD